MNTKKIRDATFTIHRYLGLIIGAIAVIIGLTGSILVFYPEINQLMIKEKVGTVTPQTESVSLTQMKDKIESVYGIEPYFVDFPKQPNQVYQFWLTTPEETYTEVFVNPYTGEILGDRPWETSLFGIVYQLHYQLLAGETGTVIAGIAAFFMFVLSFTGIVLWPGWRKLIAGFKIKWKAHPKRVNFDLHKVVGIVAAMFLGAIALTGFAWNFSDKSTPIIYAATFTPKPSEPASIPIPGQSPLSVEAILSKVELALPSANKLRSLTFPQNPTDAFRVRKRLPSQLNPHDSVRVYLDQYSGKVLHIDNPLNPNNRAEAVLNAFTPIHFGTFGGLPTRIFYVFVGLTPAILFVTGLVMWSYRKPSSRKKLPEYSDSHRG
ncbi:PepSY domain-containing protein [Gloeocapsa sp. PCC 73106]|uniref:PepSY-associated TM helix domain-containing protein n=1 Tax=Gloeocapsa sp. PCC 73106 TaxID=102232 RepID=UPI0002AC7EC1|nr:PepSY-associated TM helix domain-containing protein [Gloeocapsa sp. PCC 73106]ELR96757.1 putative iron-regulated membrane protein [Gloeocapsa sp. PCC 73106]